MTRPSQMYLFVILSLYALDSKSEQAEISPLSYYLISFYVKKNYW